MSVIESRFAVFALENIADVDALEWPIYVEPENALYFTTLPKPGPGVAIKRLSLATGEVRVVRQATNAANGMALDPDGRRVVYEQGRGHTRARISRIDPATGAIETEVDARGGLPPNSPNDVVVKSDGTIWLTDPSYGWHQGFKPEPAHGDYIYRFDARLRLVEDSFDKRTAWRSPRTSRSSTSATAARSTRSARSARARRTTSAPSTSSTASGSSTAASSP